MLYQPILQWASTLCLFPFTFQYNIIRGLNQYKDAILPIFKTHCGDKMILRPSYLHNGISYTGKMTSLYWIRALVCVKAWILGACSTFLWTALLTHWGREPHICVGNLTIIGSDNGLSPHRRQAIIWTNAGILLIGARGTSFIDISIEIQTFSYKKMHLKVSSAKWRPFCLSLNVLMILG